MQRRASGDGQKEGGGDERARARCWRDVTIAILAANFCARARLLLLLPIHHHPYPRSLDDAVLIDNTVLSYDVAHTEWKGRTAIDLSGVSRLILAEISRSMRSPL